MVSLLLDSTQLEVVLSPIEHAMSFRRRNIEIPRETITRVQLTDDAWTWLRGVPNPGTNLPVAVAMGTWKSSSGNDFVVIRRRKPSVVLDLEGHDEFERLVLTTQHGIALVQALRLDVPAEAADVAEIVKPARKPAAKPAAKPAVKPAAKPKPAASPKPRPVPSPEPGAAPA